MSKGVEEELDDLPSQSPAPRDDAAAPRARHNDSLPATRKNLEELSFFIRTKSFEVSDAVNIEIRNRLLELVKDAPAPPNQGRREETSERTKKLLQSLSEAVDDLARDAAADGAQLLQELEARNEQLVKEAVDREVWSDVVRAELASWQGRGFPSTMVAAIKHEDFAKTLGERLAQEELAFPGGVPTKQDFKEVLKADLLVWCSSTARKELPAVFQKQAADKSRSDVITAMKDLTTRSSNSLERMLEQARSKAQAENLKEKSEARIRQTIQHEVRQFEASMKEMEQSAPQAAPMTETEVEDLTARFRRHLREDGSGLQEALDDVQGEIDTTEQILKCCERLAAGPKSAHQAPQPAEAGPAAAPASAAAAVSSPSPSPSPPPSLRDTGLPFPPGLPTQPAAAAGGRRGGGGVSDWLGGM